MKTFWSLLILVLSTLTLSAENHWYGDKYSMFVHYGLYSIPAGVFRGEKVTQGYSEQILTFGIGFSDWYEAYTSRFDASHFDAKEIVALAKKGGMKSVVMTSKHHDGFCLFDTQTTQYSSINTPAHRDLIGELAEACHREGMGFGIYFSLIDWHYPYAVPFTSHNADPITPLHHQYNMKQVRELLTNYGKVDELWFDMGSLTKEQSAELYALVHQLQPECMVSGRLGNDFADFCVMADNEYPDYLMAMPWQTAASMFDETWGYRSWQERGDVEAKVQEKLASLLKVVAYGGKYLLNIGPKGDGSIVPFEEKVIKRIGEELAPIREAVYGTLPAAHNGELATLSADGHTKYIFCAKEAPRPKGVQLLASNSYYNVYRQKVRKSVVKPIYATLTPLNATPLFAHSSADYYASFRSILGYQWTIPKHKRYILTYSDIEIGKTIAINGQPLKLKPDTTETIATPQYQWGELNTAPARGRFGTIPKAPQWTPCNDDLQNGIKRVMTMNQGELYRQAITVEQATDLPITLTFSDGILVYLNGQYIDGAINRDEPNRELTLLLPLQKGENQLTIKLYNRWSTTAELKVTIPQQWHRHHQRINVEDGKLKITKPWYPPLASPAHLSALRIFQGATIIK